MNIPKPTDLLLMGISLLLTLAACQNATAGTDQDSITGDLNALDPSGVLVIYWHTLTGADEDRWLTMIDAFNASNEWGITVVGEYLGDLETVYDRIMAGLPTGQAPGAVMSTPSLVASYASQGIGVPLAPYIESEKWGFSRTEMEDFYAGALRSDRLPQFTNQLFSLPLCRSLQVLYYNADWLKELGYAEPPQTWDAFRDTACAASLPADGIFGFELGMDSSVFNSLLATQGVLTINPGATAYTLGGEFGRDGLQLLQDLISDGCAVWETEEGLSSDLSAGKILFAIDSTADLPVYRSALVKGAGFDWSLSTLPYTTDDPLIGVEGSSSTILRTTPREQLAAWLFIKWLAEPEQQAAWSRQMACFPVRRSALEQMSAFMEGNREYRISSQFLENEWITEPNVTAYDACRAEIGRMLYAITAGESIDQWLADTLDACNQSLVDAAEQD